MSRFGVGRITDQTAGCWTAMLAEVCGLQTGSHDTGTPSQPGNSYQNPATQEQQRRQELVERAPHLFPELGHLGLQLLHLRVVRLAHRTLMVAQNGHLQSNTRSSTAS